MSKPNFENIDLTKMNVSEVKNLSLEVLKYSDKNLVRVFCEVAQNDKRSSVIKIAEQTKREFKKKLDEMSRIDGLYQFDQSVAGRQGGVVLGLDEVGRGPLAGPLTVGGTILSNELKISNINDSKKLSAVQRELISKEIFEKAKFAHTISISPKKIDSYGMTECLRYAFCEVIREAQNQGNNIDVVLLDGNPMHLDRREVNVIKGDGKSASIGCASIIAKVTRDAYMDKMSHKYPNYSFHKNKGYGTAQHIAAIEKFGLSPIHRRSFCTSFMQMSLF